MPHSAWVALNWLYLHFCFFIHSLMQNFPLCRDEDETKSMLKKQDKESLNWKCVDSKVLSKMGLTSGVRKVMSKNDSLLNSVRMSWVFTFWDFILRNHMFLNFLGYNRSSFNFNDGNFDPFFAFYSFWLETYSPLDYDYDKLILP